MTECTKCRQTREKAKTVAKMASEALSKPQMVFKARDRLRVCEACSEIVRFYEFMKNTQATVTVKDKCSHKSGFIVDYVSIEDVSCPYTSNGVLLGVAAKILSLIVSISLS